MAPPRNWASSRTGRATSTCCRRCRQFLSPGIRPLRADMVVIGRAMPVLEANCFAASEPTGQLPLSRQPFGLLFQALDDLKTHEVYVATGCAPQFALWGGLMTTRAQHLKAAGAVLDGYSRDTPEVLQSGLPVFSYGGYAQDQGPRSEEHTSELQSQ